MRKNIAAIIAVSLAVFSAFAGDECAPDKSGILIKIDSTGLKATALATGRSAKEENAASAPKAVSVSEKSAVISAYKSLFTAISDMPADFFPKERYLGEGGHVRGARLIETRYYGDGSVEADVGLDIALEGLFAEKFERRMRLAGYRAVKFDAPGRELTKEELE